MLAEVTHGSNCMLGNNRIAGLFTVIFISNASHNLLQQPKPSIVSFFATLILFKPKTVQNIVLYYLSTFPRLSAAIIEGLNGGGGGGPLVGCRLKFS